jgi:hypothetical protein
VIRSSQPLKNTGNLVTMQRSERNHKLSPELRGHQAVVTARLTSKGEF